MDEAEKIYRDRIVYTNQGAEIEVALKGIHCINCINAIEKRIQKIEGISDYRFNLTFGRATFIWNPDLVGLRKILSAIEEAGFGYGMLQKTDEKEEENHRSDLKKLVTAIFFTMNLMLISVSLWVGLFTGIEHKFLMLFHLLSFAFTTPVVFYSGDRFFRGAWRAVKNRSLNMDFQVAFNALLIYLYSIFNALREGHSTYFESAAMFITFILISKHLEAAALRKMRESLKNANLRIPKFGRLCSGDSVETISCDDIKEKMLLEVLPGDSIPADGTILSGSAEIDESSLTGEYLPAVKISGDKVYSGTFLKTGKLRYEVTKKPEESTFMQLNRLLEKAMNEKSVNRTTTNFFHRHFTNLIAGLSFLTFACWLVMGASAEDALLYAVSVFIISCPCALALATPLSYLSGFRLASRYKILMKSATNFETLNEITDIVFDKTGTLTMGKPSVIDFRETDTKHREILHTLVSQSAHLLSAGLKQQLAEQGIGKLKEEFESFEELPGRGLKAIYNGETFLCGSLIWMEEENVKILDEINEFIEEQRENTLILFAANHCVAAIYAFQDEVRAKIPEMFTRLKESGKQLHLTSGDRTEPVKSFAEGFPVFEDRVYSRMSPENKKDYIQNLQNQGKKILFVGDGLNDSPAMAQSDLSICMNGGIDLAMENADLIFLENDVSLISRLFPLSRTVLRLVQSNLRLSIVYNLLAIPLAVSGLVIPPIAAASMSFSSLLVVGNALKTRKVRF